MRRGRARRHGIIPIASVGVSPPIFYFVLSRSFRSSLAIHAEAKLARRYPPALAMRIFSMDHRIKSGGDE
jgi:hypothetical protein